MSARNKPPFRADHVGSLLRPKSLLKAREDAASGAISTDELRAIEDDAIRDVVQDAAGGRIALDHRRRAPARFLAHGLHLRDRRDRASRATPEERLPQRGRRHRVHAVGGPRIAGKLGMDHTIFGIRLRVPPRHGHDRHAEADDPRAQPGPLPRRPRRDRPGRLPGHRRRSGTTSAPPTPRRSGGSATRLHLPAVRRHEPRAT